MRQLWLHSKPLLADCLQDKRNEPIQRRQLGKINSYDMPEKACSTFESLFVFISWQGLLYSEF